MGKTVVCNLGKPKIPDDELQLEFGLFFDGTLNNMNNTALRQKYKDGENKIEDTDSKEEVEAKEEIFRQKTKEQEQEYKQLKNKNKPEESSEYEQYLKAIYRTSLDKRGVDNSFSNDYTNVARMFKSYERKYYGIYIEGIGTLNNLRDVDDGFQYGSGHTGVRGKVRVGCEKLVERIIEVKRSNKKAKLSTIYIDIFGFSRGAAAARNFSYEINGNKRPQDVEIKKIRKVIDYEISIYENGSVPVYETIWIDKDKTEVNPEFLVDGKLPKYGFLGYYLLKYKALTKEELYNLDIQVRFIGIYDTVAAYEEFGDMEFLERIGVRGVTHSVRGSSHYFGDDVEQLQLNNLGSYYKAVHFTAMDEHRENFSLNKLQTNTGQEKYLLVEKEFPGVHCDIGGAYETGTEVVKEIETSNHKLFYFLNRRKQQLIDEYWYKKEQLEIKNIFLYRKIQGTRFLRKEYSYIPLHFMVEFGEPYVGHQLIMPIEKDYSIEHDQYLITTKKYLRPYIFEGATRWDFITDKDLEKNRIDSRLTENEEIINDYLNCTNQELLRILRNRYLHWSADRTWMGMDPNNDYKRRIY